MKLTGVPVLGVAFAVAVILCFIDVAASSRSNSLARQWNVPMKYEFAVLDKALSGSWSEQRTFRQYLQETFDDPIVSSFEPDSELFDDWLQKESRATVKIICRMDGWTSPNVVRVEVRGTWGNKPVRRAFEVKDGNWRSALQRAKQFCTSYPSNTAAR